MATTTWNPSDKNTGVTLSNGNLTATNNNNVQPQGVRAVDEQSTGKFYWEYVFNTTNNVCDAVGICSASCPLNTQMNFSSGQGYAVVVPYTGGQIYNSGSSPAALGTISNGSLIGVAVDCTARQIWFRLGASGNWNNSGTANPATGTGGIVLSNFSGPVYPLGQVASTNSQITANFGATSFTGAVPSGFTAGFPPSPPAGVQVTKVALEQWGGGAAAQVTQIALEMWASVALYTPPPANPTPPPGKSKGKGQGKGKGGQPVQFGAPALQGEVERFAFIRPWRRHRTLVPWALPPVTALALAEAASTAAAISASVLHSAALSESAVTTAAITAGRVLAATLAESASTADALHATATVLGLLIESAHGTDAPSAHATMVAHLTDGAVTSDMPYHGVTFPGMLSESAVTSSAITAFLTAHAALSETAATSAAVAGFRTLVAPLSESGTASDALSGKRVAVGLLSEGAAAAETLSAMARMTAGLSEGSLSQDAAHAVAVIQAAIAESAGTIDADTYIATTHPLRRSAKLIGEHATPDLIGEWFEPPESP